MNRIDPLVSTFAVGKREVTMTGACPAPGEPIAVHMEWSTPDVPPRFSDAEWAQYRNGRDAGLRAACAALGVPALVVDL